MLIQLKQIEIEEAVKDYIGKQGIALVGKELEVNFVSTRGASGITAEVDINPAALNSSSNIQNNAFTGRTADLKLENVDLEGEGEVDTDLILEALDAPKTKASVSLFND